MPIERTASDTSVQDWMLQYPGSDDRRDALEPGGPIPDWIRLLPTLFPPVPEFIRAIESAVPVGPPTSPPIPIPDPPGPVIRPVAAPIINRPLPPGIVPFVPDPEIQREETLSFEIPSEVDDVSQYDWWRSGMPPIVAQDDAEYGYLMQRGIGTVRAGATGYLGGNTLVGNEADYRDPTNLQGPLNTGSGGSDVAGEFSIADLLWQTGAGIVSDIATEWITSGLADTETFNPESFETQTQPEPVQTGSGQPTGVSTVEAPHPSHQPVPPGAGHGPNQGRGWSGWLWDPHRGRWIKRRRRRKRLLTESDFNDLMRISTLPNKENVKVALAKAIGR